MLSEDSRNEKKLKAVRRAQFRLKQALERVDWEYDVLLPEIQDYKARASLPELPEGLNIETEIVVAPNADKTKPEA